MKNNYLNEEVLKILNEGNVISIYNGIPKIGNSNHYDILCIREEDLKNIMNAYKQLGYWTFGWMSEYMLVKGDYEELRIFSRTSEMKERYKNWDDADYPPDLVRTYYLRKASYKARMIIDKGLKRI